MSSETKYYIRAYATNEAGTSYGEVKHFVTKASEGIITDFENNEYETIIIGNQLWMKQNLESTKYSDGTPITEIYPPNNNEENIAEYGYLYSWYSAVNYSAIEKPQGACPVGWHIPSTEEWVELSNYLGGVSVAGGKLKEEGTTHWLSPNVGATNSSRFTALPSGYRGVNLGFWKFKEYAIFWTSNPFSESNSEDAQLINDSETIRLSINGGGAGSNTSGYSVRCIKD